MEPESPKQLRDRLIDQAKNYSKTVDTLLEDVAKAGKASLQTVAVELWDAIQWGELNSRARTSRLRRSP